MHLPNPFFFSSDHMASVTSVCYRESKQRELIESVRTNEQLFTSQSLTQTEVQKPSKTCCFWIEFRNKALSWFGVYSFGPGFHYGYPCLCDLCTTWMPAMHSRLAATLAGCYNAAAKSKCKYLPLNWYRMRMPVAHPVLKYAQRHNPGSSEVSQGVYDQNLAWILPPRSSDQIQPVWVKNLPDCAAPLQ